MMKTTCKKCGESFSIDKSTEDLFDEGFIVLSDICICEDCYDMMQNTDFEYEQQSDADPGL
jgi:hydrogenase maturation factor HypF (carbamoyltransferase family)